MSFRMRAISPSRATSADAATFARMLASWAPDEGEGSYRASSAARAIVISLHSRSSRRSRVTSAPPDHEDAIEAADPFVGPAEADPGDLRRRPRVLREPGHLVSLGELQRVRRGPRQGVVGGPAQEF